MHSLLHFLRLKMLSIADHVFKIVGPAVILVKPPCGVECVSRRKDTVASGSNFVQKGGSVFRQGGSFVQKGQFFVL